MRILLTTHQFLPDYSAGTEVLTFSVARELIKRGHVVHVLCGYPEKNHREDVDRFDEYDFNGVHVYRFFHSYAAMGNQTSMIEIGYDNHLASDYCERITNRFKPERIHFFHLNRLGTGLIELAVGAGIPCSFTPTDFWAICPTGQLMLDSGRVCLGPSAYSGNCLKHLFHSSQTGLFAKAVNLLPTAWADVLVRFALKGPRALYPKQQEVVALAKRLHVNVSRLNKLKQIVAPNVFMKEFLVRHGVKDELISLVPYGIDMAVHTTSDPCRPHGNPLRIGFIGTLAPHKGCHVLIEAFKALPAGSAILKIYGGLDDFPDYTGELKSMVSRVPSVEFCGTFPNSQIPSIFSGLDVLVVPSLWYENTPLVLYSAQAACCPAIVSNHPGLTEVIQADLNGLVFEPGRSSDLAQQLLRLINERGLLIKLSERARPPKSTGQYVDELLAIWAAA